MMIAYLRIHVDQSSARALQAWKAWDFVAIGFVITGAFFVGVSVEKAPTKSFGRCRGFSPLSWFYKVGLLDDFATRCRIQTAIKLFSGKTGHLRNCHRKKGGFQGMKNHRNTDELAN